MLQAAIEDANVPLDMWASFNQGDAQQGGVKEWSGVKRQRTAPPYWR